MDKMAWFKEAKFGMFIHWGLYSILARGEWVMYLEKIPIPEYEKLVHRFRPHKFCAEDWVLLAKSAGMKYIVITTKHCDGFCLYDSKLTDYDVMSTPIPRDYVAELVTACRKHGLKIGFYYSLIDWHHPACQSSLEAYTPIPDEYIAYCHGQVAELCTNYGKIDILWFDAGWFHHDFQWKADKLYDLVHRLQPDALVNDRIGDKQFDLVLRAFGEQAMLKDPDHLLPGDFSTPEQNITYLSLTAKRYWETCMTMNDSWGYCQGDKNWKSTRQLINNLVLCTHANGNYLLNVGPKPDGTIPNPSVKRLYELGTWMERNSEAVYGISFTTVNAGTVGAVGTKGNTFYLYILRWPSGNKITVTGVKEKIQSIYFLADKKAIPFRQESDRLIITHLPSNPPDLYVTVLVLQY